MLYVIGLGLNVEGFSFEAYNAVKNSRKVYLESYTVEFPYKQEILEEKLQKKVKPLEREQLEGDEAVTNLLKEAREQNVALLVYGGPLNATTHYMLIEEAKKSKVPYRIIQGASIMDAVSETGLSLYKFGKTASLPKFEAPSFMDVVIANQSIDAHTLILVDIGLDFGDALDLFERACKSKKFDAEQLMVASRLGTRKGKVWMKSFKAFKKDKKSLRESIRAPFCFIIPSLKLNQMEEEALSSLQ